MYIVKIMKIVYNCFLVFLVVVMQKLYGVSSNRLEKEEGNFMNFLPSNSLLYPLDFQQNWQASEPIPVTIHYNIPSYGHKDLLMALESYTDLENYQKESEENKRRIIEEQNRLEDILWNKIQLIKVKDKKLQRSKHLRTYKDKI
ncbi:hypothetical protein YYC_03016 [Plasmodium yoelii 17X]|uniref:Uncharacterized protein n=3 Tax=Plasmodium yoelii TaxID=5861 RepID=A0A077YGA1_PLAYE|nr:conserved protein, unknown function [Plasmodium yoelii]ETB59566.1 hypothetical protein YYC_03016 [Plasmodium yoelii 17X]CDU85114.1 conserved Plasmodium protein, unknown function [Plasmodium yoelii]VTZ79009.1 conserved protein, unknown function [Plasmodium yoelii]|eukprot:XP_022813357.1 conserved protein, unknown function [Plasmodium yoelii]